MNREAIARELLAVARELVAVDVTEELKAALGSKFKYLPRESNRQWAMFEWRGGGTTHRTTDKALTVAEYALRDAGITVGSGDLAATNESGKVVLEVFMGRAKLAKLLVGAIREGETYELDLRRALGSSWSTPQWARLVKQLHRRSDGNVTVDEVDANRGVAMVYEANNPAARILGTIQVPLDSLR